MMVETPYFLTSGHMCLLHTWHLCHTSQLCALCVQLCIGKSHIRSVYASTHLPVPVTDHLTRHICPVWHNCQVWSLHICPDVVFSSLQGRGKTGNGKQSNIPYPETPLQGTISGYRPPIMKGSPSEGGFSKKLILRPHNVQPMHRLHGLFI